MKFVRYDDLKEFTKDMKLIYGAPNIEVALDALDEFEKKWGNKYSYAIKSWRDNLDELTTFFKYPFELRRLIYTTNIIENLNRNIRKITKTKNNFTNVKSLEKIILQMSNHLKNLYILQFKIKYQNELLDLKIEELSINKLK